MEPKRGEVMNALLQAVQQTIGAPPPDEEWMTLIEICKALKLTEAQAHRRLGMLVHAGRAEKLRAPCRSGTGGQTFYYRLKTNGKGKP